MRRDTLQDGVVIDDDGSRWDPKLAVELVGKRVLVGITDLAPDGSVLGRREFCGQAIRADWRTGIALRLEGVRAGEEVVLPPDTRAFHPAAPGEYRLRQTGEVVKDPDFFTTWSLGGRDKTQDH
ncbi:hypothetical protein GCM10009416_32730 [Craurococcus roseus]|uniref:Uncharacterized protein n=1 Tax=Craurococcus roseus TaxID=77585 RepID=A0ABP3QMF2_9PROT